MLCFILAGKLYIVFYLVFILFVAYFNAFK
jgi:hypothetical protein